MSAGDPAAVPAAGPTPFDLSEPRRVHVVGVGGAGMSAIAIVLAQMGHRVSGSDLKASPGLDALRALGVDVHVGHAAAHVGDVDALTTSTAVPATNPEVVEARRRGLPVLRRAEILAAIARACPTIAVAGTHGKTTTSSMLALALTQAGLDPSFVIGGEVNEIGTGARWSGGPWLVVEADESDGTFLELPTALAVVTNVEPDHLDHWGGFANLEAAFRRFVDGAGQAVLCADDPGAAALARPGDATYGTSPEATYRMVDLELGRTSTGFTLRHGADELGRVELPLPGVHNARNAAGAAVAAMVAGAPFEAARDALARFGGVARRFEFRGEAGGVTFVDDYAHLPSEVRAALQAARQGGWSRVVCVFQPHRFSRTEALAASFADAFDDADVLAVTEIYAAGEAPRPGVTGKLVLDAVLDAHPRRRAAWLPHRADVLTWLRSELRPGDLCLTLGAGDLTSLPDQLLASWPPAP